MAFFAHNESSNYCCSYFVDLNKDVENIHEFFAELDNFDKPVTNNAEYIDYIEDILKKKSIEPIVPDKKYMKSSEQTNDLRIQGNNKFATQEYYSALKLYTKSIAYAPTGSEELGLAYANRSAVLLEKEYYKECLEDIERALQNCYPENKKEKLLNRRNIAQNFLQSSKQFVYSPTPPNIQNPHSDISAASANITIDNSSGSTRILAKNRIKAGEILMIEDPIVNITFPDSDIRYKHCHECMEICFNMIPCEKCTLAMYCTIKCRRNAFVKYHRYDCSIFSVMEYSVPFIMSVRLTILELKGRVTQPADNSRNIFNSDRYNKINTYINAKLTTKMQLKLALIPALFYLILIKTDLLLEYDFQNNQHVLKELLIKNSLLFMGYSYAVLKVDHCQICEIVGAGMYAEFSFFNHSCIPNVGTAFFGKKLVAYARKNIKPGEECFVTYDVVYSDVPKIIREEVLARRFIECTCKACTYNWPSKIELINTNVNNLFINIIKDFQQGKITDKEKLLRDCNQYLLDLREVEWSLNKIILNTLISKCITSMGNQEVVF